MVFFLVAECACVVRYDENYVAGPKSDESWWCERKVSKTI